ncbi:MAG: hypothetical protein HBSAPP04_14800 [Ignavibacteriaceae bacterium]|nr:MAG: hypothetical protein HBSAPP04_14800 [Ignavibacteriaceae bacterium]
MISHGSTNERIFHKVSFSWGIVLVTLIYFVMARASLLLALPGSDASPVWPPSGLALAALLIFGRRIWPAITLGAFAANLLAIITGPDETALLLAAGVALMTAIGNTIEALVAFFLIVKFADHPDFLFKVKSVVIFTISAILASLLAAVAGPVTFCAAGLAPWSIFPGFFITWWLGDFSGMIIFAPMVFLLCRNRTIINTPRELLNLGLISLGLIFLSVMIFTSNPDALVSMLMPYILFPVTIWISQKFDPLIAGTGIVLLTIIAVFGTVHGYGTFAIDSRNSSLLLLQGFVSILGFTSLSFSAATAERKLYQKAAEEKAEELARERTLLRAIIDIIPDAVYTKDLELKKTLANPADLSNMHVHSEADVIGKTDMELHPQALAEKFMEDDKYVVSTGKPILNREEFVIDEDGEIVWLLTSKLPLRDMKGEIIGLLGIGKNVTESVKSREEIKILNTELEKRVEQRTAQLEAKNKELEAFSYSVSHDLRAPLRHINGYVDLLNRKFRGDIPEKGQHYLDTITNAAKQMGELIDDLLQFSRTGRAEMHLARYEMQPIVDDLISGIMRDEPDRKFNWKVAPLPSVVCDQPLIRQVWVNLLSNAAKFTKRKEIAEIEVGCNEEDGKVVFYVKDDGVGFDMQYAGKLFGVFQRLHSKEEFDGTGIGLANVQRIILRHEGMVWAEAEADKGATFYFSLPVTLKETS